MVTSTSRVRVAAPREFLWRCLTEPELVARWQYGARLDTTWEPGAPIRFTVTTDAGEFAQWGEVVEVRAPESLAYTLFAPREGLGDVAQNRFTMRYLLAEVDGVVELTIVQEDPRPGSIDRSDDGSPVLESLRVLAESLV